MFDGGSDTPNVLKIRAQRVAAGHTALEGVDRRRMMNAALGLQRYADWESHGLKVILMAQAGDSQVALDYRPPASPPLGLRQWEGAYWAHFGRAIAAADLGDHVQAIASIGTARAYAELLGDDRSQQMMRMEVARITNLMGRANPEAVERLADEPMSDVRRKWFTAEVVVAARIQVGDYGRAAELALPTHIYGVLMSAFLGQQPELPKKLTPGHRVGIAWADLWAGRPVANITTARGSILQTYGRLAYALWMAGDIITAKHVPGLLGTTPPDRPDQAVLWAAAQLQAFARGARLDDPLHVCRVMSLAFNDLQQTEYVLNLLRHLAPEAATIAASAQSVHPDFLAVVTGWAYSIPMRSLEGVREGYQLAPYRATAGRKVNMGIVLCGIERMANTAAEKNLRFVEAEWLYARANIWQLLSGEERGSVGYRFLHCAVDDSGRTMRA